MAATTLSAADQALIDSYQKKWQTANAAGDTQGMLDAHNAAEGVRARYGFSGGDDGSQYIPLGSQSSLPDSDKYINDIYTGQVDAATAALDSAYQQNVNELNAAAAKIPGQYQTARNQAASQSAVERANFNEYAAASGLNSGAGGQAQLAFGNQLQANLSGITQSEADALADLDLQRTQLATKYKSDIAQAVAEGNAEKAQALREDYWRQAERLDSQKQFDASMNYNTGNSEFDQKFALWQITQDPSLLSKWLTPQQIEDLRKKLGL